jgi:crotonobetainyl-CoA:carnitine CoA-transferase CaiB-like acyl-CoA transferase
VVNDPQVRHNGSLVSYRHPTEGEVTTPGFAIRFTKSPSSVRRGAPLAGEQTREILAELGLSEQQVNDLLAAEVVAAEQP